MSWSKSLVGNSMPVLRCGAYLEEWFGEVTSKGSTPSFTIYSLAEMMNDADLGRDEYPGEPSSVW